MLLGIIGLAAGSSQPPIAGLKVWLAADSGVSKTGSNVTQWDDQTSFANHFTPPGANPQFVASAVNGKPAISFDGSSQYLTAAFQLDGAKQVIMVRKLTNTPPANNFYCPFQVSDTSNNSGTFMYYCNSGSYQPTTFVADLVTTEITTTGVAGALDTGWHVDELSYNGLGNTTPGNYVYALDGVAKTVVVDNQEGNSTPITVSSLGVDLGASNAAAGDYFKGSLAEVLVYDHVLSGGDESILRSYLEAKYGIALGAP